MALWSNGIGETAGGTLASTDTPLLISAGVIFCHYGTGNDANAGTDRASPKKTISGAYSAAAANGCIVLLDGHDEPITASLTLAKAGLTICGAGMSAGVPTCVFQQQGAGYFVFSVTAAGTTIDGVRFEASAGAGSSAMIDIQANEFVLRNSRVEVNANNPFGGVQAVTGTPSDLQFIDTTFVCTGASGAAAPLTGLYGTVATTRVTLSGVTFDGGVTGFTAGGVSWTADITRLRGENVSLLRGADAAFTASTTGYFNIATATGNARVVWSGGAA